MQNCWFLKNPPLLICTIYLQYIGFQAACTSPNLPLRGTNCCGKISCNTKAALILKNLKTGSVQWPLTLRLILPARIIPWADWKSCFLEASKCIQMLRIILKMPFACSRNFPAGTVCKSINSVFCRAGGEINGKKHPGILGIPGCLNLKLPIKQGCIILMGLNKSIHNIHIYIYDTHIYNLHIRFCWY